MEEIIEEVVAEVFLDKAQIRVTSEAFVHVPEASTGTIRYVETTTPKITGQAEAGPGVMVPKTIESIPLRTYLPFKDLFVKSGPLSYAKYGPLGALEGFECRVDYEIRGLSSDEREQKETKLQIIRWDSRAQFGPTIWINKVDQVVLGQLDPQGVIDALTAKK